MGLLPLKRDARFKQGYFKPDNISKYIGSDIPIYRSGIELKFFKFCDSNPNVIRWSSETISVPYFDLVKNKMRKYYVDNFVEIREGKIVKKYLVEIKDSRETKQPNPSSKKKKTTLIYEQCQWVTNTCKWKSAIKFCEKHNIEFLLLAYSEKSGFLPITLDFLNYP